MKYVRTAGFLIDLRRLPAEHRKLFVLAVHTLLPPPWTRARTPALCHGREPCAFTGLARTTR
jgi:hypothetical protein